MIHTAYGKADWAGRRGGDPLGRRRVRHPGRRRSSTSAATWSSTASTRRTPRTRRWSRSTPTAGPRPQAEADVATAGARRRHLPHVARVRARSTRPAGRPGSSRPSGGRAITLFTDEVRCPIRADDLAAPVWDVVALPRADRSGPWHLVGPDAFSRHDLGVVLADAHGLDRCGHHAAGEPGPSPSLAPGTSAHAPEGPPCCPPGLGRCGASGALGSNAMQISTSAPLRRLAPPRRPSRSSTSRTAGLDIVWVAEAYGFDAVSLMGYLAANTERVADRARASCRSTPARRRCWP